MAESTVVKGVESGCFVRLASVRWMHWVGLRMLHGGFCDS